MLTAPVVGAVAVTDLSAARHTVGGFASTLQRTPATLHSVTSVAIPAVTPGSAAAAIELIYNRVVPFSFVIKAAAPTPVAAPATRVALVAAGGGAGVLPFLFVSEPPAPGLPGTGGTRAPPGPLS